MRISTWNISDLFLENYGKDLYSFLCLIGDNCNTNKSAADKMQILLVGSASHRFKLGVQLIIESESNIVEMSTD